MKKSNKLLALILFAGCAAFAAFALSGCGYCQHKLDEVLPATASTCLEQGYKKAYKCSKCKQLFGFDRVKNVLYEIDEQELADFAGHTAGGEFVGVIHEGAETFADVHVEDTCKVCGETYTVDPANLFHVIGADNSNEHKTDIGGESGKEVYTFYSQFTLPEGSEASEETPIFTCKASSNTDRRVNVDIPFTQNIDRYCMAFFRNNGDIDVDVMYGAENVDELCLSESVTVPAGGYASVPFTVNFQRDSQPRCWTRLYLLSDIDREVKLDMCTYYYDSDTKLTQTAFSQIGSTSYIEGEKIDPDGIIFREEYAGGAVRIKTGRCAESAMYGHALTVDDELVEVIYGGKKYNYYISVASSKRTLTLVGAEFADGSHSKLVPYDADQPNDIVFKDNAIFLYWTDIYGEKIPYGFNMEGNDKTLRAVYAGDGQTDFDAPIDYGTNYALNKSVESSSVYGGENGTWKISQLTDGKRTYSAVHIAAQTNQSFEKDDEAWFMVDLGEVTTINEIHLYGRADGVYFPKGYYIEVSEDGENWTTVFTNENDIHSLDKAYTKPRLCFFEDADARYVRITSSDLTSAGSGYYFALAEMEVYNVR